MTEPLRCLAWFFPTELSLLWQQLQICVVPGPGPIRAGPAPAQQARKLACQVTRARARAAQAFASEERPRSTRPSNGGV